MDISLLPDDPAILKQIIHEYSNNITNLRESATNLKKEFTFTIESLQSDIMRLNETIKVYRHKLFGRHSENLPKAEQPGLFNEAEIEERLIKSEDSVEKIKISFERLKKSGKRPLPDDLPREKIVIDLSEEEKKCLCCGNNLVKIGEEISEKLEIIPQQVRVIQYIRPKYSCSCNKCKREGSKIITAELPPMLIPQGIATASSAAYVFKTKFVDAMPYYRQETMFSSIGIDLSRATMCNWQTYIYYNYLTRLIDLMRSDLKKSYLIQADETTVQVIVEKEKPPDSKSYMWVYRGYWEKNIILLYDYSPNRKGENPRRYLEGYEGYLQTDGYDGYNLAVKENKIVRLACWAHVRRKFFDCFKVLKERNYPESKIILDMIQSLYGVEKKARGLSEKEIFELRQKESKPITEKIKSWLQENEDKYPPKSGMGQAINYALSLWENLTVYLEDGRLFIDNNWIENSIRPFVIGRKNWLFSYSEDGANSSAAIYSLIETAKANGKEPYKYLKELFEKIPHAKTDEDYKKLLPYYDANLFDE